MRLCTHTADTARRCLAASVEKKDEAPCGFTSLLLIKQPHAITVDWEGGTHTHRRLAAGEP